MKASFSYVNAQWNVIRSTKKPIEGNNVVKKKASQKSSRTTRAKNQNIAPTDGGLRKHERKYLVILHYAQSVQFK
jgi:hypothetical protein